MNEYFHNIIICFLLNWTDVWNWKPIQFWFLKCIRYSSNQITHFHFWVSDDSSVCSNDFTTSMLLFMMDQTWGINSLPFACIARVRSFSSMSPSLVDSQFVVSNKALATFFTNKWLFISVFRPAIMYRDVFKLEIPVKLLWSLAERIYGLWHGVIFSIGSCWCHLIFLTNKNTSKWRQHFLKQIEQSQDHLFVMHWERAHLTDWVTTTALFSLNCPNTICNPHVSPNKAVINTTLL